jgi:multidrug efflux system membrane fusion protein
MNNPPSSPDPNTPTANPAHQMPAPPDQPLLKEHNEAVPPGEAGKPDQKHQRPWITWILILLVIVLGVGAFILLSGKKPKPPAPPPVTIGVINVVKGDIPVSVSSLGSVQPVYTATMSPRVDGQLIAVNYTEGQMVGSNDLLAVIDPGPYQAALTQAAGQLQRDKALLEGANVDLKRYQEAVKKNAVPQQQVDDQVALVHQDEGTVKYDEGQVENAKVQLAYAYIRAPFPGRVGLRLVDPGNVVHAANTNAIVIVAQLEPITVVFNVAEDYLPQIEEQLHSGPQTASAAIEEQYTPELTPDQPKPGHSMTVEAWDRANENKIAEGRVLALNNLIDTATGTIRIKAIFANTNLTLFPNQFVNAKLIIKTLHDVNLIPTFAIQHNPEGAFVYVVTNTAVVTNGMTTNYLTVTTRPVVPGTADGNTTAITRGLQAGEVIATNNFNKLVEGARVALRKSETAGASNGKKHTGSYGKKAGAEQESP